MAMKATFLVQTFVLKRKRLVPGDQQILTTSSAARKRAEAMAALMPGTAALQVATEDETGKLESATILGQYGEVPDDFTESLEAA